MRFFWGRVCVVAAALTVASATAAAAAPRPGDVKATRTFIAIGERYFAQSIARQAAIRHKTVAFVDSVASSCSDSLTGLAMQTGSQTALKDQAVLATEAQIDYVVTFMRALPLHAAAASLRSLQWSKRGLTRAVGSFARSALILSALRPTNLCADIRASAATGFETLPAATRKFVKGLTAIPDAGSSASWDGLLTRMRGYETASMRRADTRFRSLDKRSAKALGKTYGDQYTRLGNVLLGPGAAG